MGLRYGVGDVYNYIMINIDGDRKYWGNSLSRVRFLSSAWRFRTEDEALEEVANISKDHPDWFKQPNWVRVYQKI